MIDGFDRLGHDPVVGGDDEHHDVGDLGAAGAHGREGLVARGVDEGDQLAVALDLVGADVLGDAAGLTGHDVSGADAVEEERLAVVHVAHDRDDRRARPQVLFVLLFFVLVLEVLGQQFGLALFTRVHQADLGPELGREQLDHVIGQRLGGGDHLALEQEEADDVARRAVQLRPDVARRRAALDDDLARRNGRGRGHVRRELRRLELFEVAPATPRAPLGWAASSGRSATAPGGTA